MANELAVMKNVDDMLPTTEVLQKMKVLADYYVSAGLLPPGYKTGADLMVVAIRGRELGVSLGQAVAGMFPMQGRIGYMGGFLLSMVTNRLPNADIRIKESTKEKCVLEWVRYKESDEYQTEEYSMDEVEACNYHRNPVKDSATGQQKVDSTGHPIWKEKGPWGDRKNMLYWRCVGRVINRHFSDVFGSQVYQYDELQDMETVDVPPQAKAAVSVPYETEKNKPAVESIEEAVIVPKEPVVTTILTEEQKPKMTQNMIDVLVSQFEKDIYATKNKREIDEIFEKFKKTGVSGTVLTNCFKIFKARKEEIK